jgi:hypothetical protein
MTMVQGSNSSVIDRKIFHKLVSRICLSVAPLSLVLWVVYLVLAHKLVSRMGFNVNVNLDSELIDGGMFAVFDFVFLPLAQILY